MRLIRRPRTHELLYTAGRDGPCQPAHATASASASRRTQERLRSERLHVREAEVCGAALRGAPAAGARGVEVATKNQTQGTRGSERKRGTKGPKQSRPVTRRVDQVTP